MEAFNHEKQQYGNSCLYIHCVAPPRKFSDLAVYAYIVL